MSEDLPTICGGCFRINVDGQMVEQDSHADYYSIRRKIEDIGRYCPECTERFSKEYQRIKREYQLMKN